LQFGQTRESIQLTFLLDLHYQHAYPIIPQIQPHQFLKLLNTIQPLNQVTLQIKFLYPESPTMVLMEWLFDLVDYGDLHRLDVERFVWGGESAVQNLGELDLCVGHGLWSH
jgi:hypothetical protein